MSQTQKTKSAEKEETNLKFKHQKLFNKYLINYETLPSYKKILSTMIKFKGMYQPITRGPLYVDTLGHLATINEIRKVRRMEVYLNKRDLIQTFDENWGKRIIVTSRGHKIFYEDYPLAKLREKPWDGIWTVVMYDFPEKERAKRKMIRDKLIKLGFGSPQISILISPLPIEKPVQQFLEGKGVEDKVWTLRASRILGMENREVALKAWPIIKELNILYKELLEMLSKTEKEKEFLSLWKTYFLAVNSADPYLPFELLPKDWKGKECEKAFIKLGPGGFLKALFKELSF